MREKDIFAQKELKRVRDQARQNAASYILQRIDQATQGRPETVQGSRAPVKYARKPRVKPDEG